MFSAIKSICCSGCCLAFLGFGFTASIATSSTAIAAICSSSLRASASVSFVADGFLRMIFAMTASPHLFVHADEFPRHGHRCNARARQRRPVCTDHLLPPKPALVAGGERLRCRPERALGEVAASELLPKRRISAIHAHFQNHTAQTTNRQGETKNCCGGGAARNWI